MDWSLLLRFLVPLCALIAIAVFLVERSFSDNGKSAQDTPRDPHATCSLCSRPKSEVDGMVAGEAGSLCSDCLINSVALLDDASRNDENGIRFVHRLLIGVISRSRESGRRDATLESCVREAGVASPERRARILSVADGYANTSFIADLLDHVPREDWTPDDVMSWLHANFNEGRYEDALDHPELEREDCSDAEFRVFTLNRIACRIETDPGREEIARDLVTLDSMRRFYERDEYPYPQDGTLALPNVLGTMAKCHYLLGNHDEALACLDEEAVAEVPSSYRELLRGNVHERRGEMEAAKLCWEKGVRFDERNVFHDQLVEKLNTADEEHHGVPG